MERVFEVLETDIDKPDVEDASVAGPEIDEIKFENVFFAYQTNNELNDLSAKDQSEHVTSSDANLPAQGGSVVALVGRSGAGKTTVTDLVARFYDPRLGRVTLNGHDLREYQLQSYRDLIGIVQQDVFLFDGTVFQNIAYANRDATHEQVIAAAQQANADEFISKLENGYDSIVGERGVKLSGGQRQRLAIARALLADPKILILDEATSNLDTESEQLIQQSMKTLLKNRTTFVIAHRLSTIKDADQIVVIDDGQILEKGTHQTLLRLGGKYANMVARQNNSID